MTARCAGVPAPCTSELISTNPGTDQASDPASAGVRNEVAIKTGAASTNYRRLDVAGSALAGLSTGMAPPRLAEKENALRCAGAHGKASVPERQGVPGTSLISGFRRPNSTGFVRTCRMPGLPCERR